MACPGAQPRTMFQPQTVSKTSGKQRRKHQHRQEALTRVAAPTPSPQRMEHALCSIPKRLLQDLAMLIFRRMRTYNDDCVHATARSYLATRQVGPLYAAKNNEERRHTIVRANPRLWQGTDTSSHEDSCGWMPQPFIMTARDAAGNTRAAFHTVQTSTPIDPTFRTESWHTTLCRADIVLTIV